MYDILFAIFLSVFLVIEGIFNENNTIFPVRIVLIFGLIPLLAVMTIIEFIFWGGDNIPLLIIAVASLVAIIGFVIKITLAR